MKHIPSAVAAAFLLLTLSPINVSASLLDFQKSPATSPVVPSGYKDLPFSPSDPFVLKDQTGFHLFYFTPFCKKGGQYNFSYDKTDASYCDFSDISMTLGYAFSSDQGQTWEYRTTPIINSMPSSWDGQIETPNVVRVGDTLYLFYSAYTSGGAMSMRYQIGVASLNLGGKSIYDKLMTDKAMFDRGSRTTPILPGRALGNFDMNTQEPSVLYRNGRFELYYTGLELSQDGPLTSSTTLMGVNMGKAVFDSNLNLISRASAPMLGWINILEVAQSSTTDYLFYTTGGDGELHKDQVIAYRTSPTGQDIWSSPTEILSKGTTNSFDNWGVMAPTLVHYANDLYLFYTAFEVDDISCFDPSVTRFGVPVENNTKCSFSTFGRAVCADCVAFAPLDVLAPSTPQNLKAKTVQSTKIDLSWATSTDSGGLAGYKIYRNNIEIGTSLGTSYTDSNLGAKTSYTYAVSAYDEVGNESARSASISTTTLPYDLTSGRVLHYKFDEGSGLVASDASGKGNTGTVKAGWTNTGKIGKGLDTNGSTQYVYASDSASLDTLGAFTIAFWMKADTLPTYSTGDNWRTLIKKEGNVYWVRINAQNNTLLGFVNIGGWKVFPIPSIVLVPNTWYHVAMTYDGSYLSTYINGDSVGTPVPQTGSTVNGSSSLNIVVPASGQEKSFDGKLDEVRIYNRGLNAGEVKALYNYPN